MRAPDTALGLRELPALEALRCIWLQQYDRCTVPGRDDIRWRTRVEQPPSALRIASPYDLEARDRSKRDTHWVGYQVHLTETCDAGQPDLITQVLTTPASTHHIGVVGPPFGSYSRQRRAGQGDDLQAFVLDWDAQQAHGPQGHTNVNWRPGHDVSGDPVIRIRFDGATCRACPTRLACTSARGAPRQLTVRLHTHHEAIQTARQRQETPEFKA